MSGMQVFKNADFGEIRVHMAGSEPWFVARDVCAALDIDATQTRRLDEDEKGMCSIQTPGGMQEMQTVNEPGLYALVLGSRKPEARAFKRWITHDVLPTIRKTGGYVNDDDAFVNTYLPDADEATRAMFRATLQTVRAQNQKIRADAPKVLFAEAVEASTNSILVGELAKLLKQNGVEDMGQNRLFRWLRHHGYVVKRPGTDYNMPTQRSMEQGLFEIRESHHNRRDGSTKTDFTAMVTGKGQVYFINKFLNEGNRTKRTEPETD